MIQCFIYVLYVLFLTSQSHVTVCLMILHVVYVGKENHNVFIFFIFLQKHITRRAGSVFFKVKIYTNYGWNFKKAVSLIICVTQAIMNVLIMFCFCIRKRLTQLAVPSGSEQLSLFKTIETAWNQMDCNQQLGSMLFLTLTYY